MLGYWRGPISRYRHHKRVGRLDTGLVIPSSGPHTGAVCRTVGSSRRASGRPQTWLRCPNLAVYKNKAAALRAAAGPASAPGSASEARPAHGGSLAGTGCPRARTHLGPGGRMLDLPSRLRDTWSGWPKLARRCCHRQREPGRRHHAGNRRCSGRGCRSRRDDARDRPEKERAPPRGHRDPSEVRCPGCRDLRSRACPACAEVDRLDRSVRARGLWLLSGGQL